MADTDKRKNLGRGLSALLGEDSEDYAELDKVRTSKMVPIEFLQPGKYQPRHGVKPESIDDLAQSVREKGILQPILVRRLSDDPNAFEIIAGERRWRAAQKVQLHEVPVVIRDLNDQEALEIALIENLQRQDLSPLEEAEGYQRLMDEFRHTQEALGKALGKSRSHVANTLRLLGLPEPVKELVNDGALSAGHARALLTAADPAALAEQVVARGLNVRQTEKLVQQKSDKPKKPSESTPAKDADTLALERDLSSLLGLKVAITFRGGGGTLTLSYGSLEQLDDILHRLSHGSHGSRTAAAPKTEPIPANDIPLTDTAADMPEDDEPIAEEALDDLAIDDLALDDDSADGPAALINETDLAVEDSGEETSSVTIADDLDLDETTVEATVEAVEDELALAEATAEEPVVEADAAETLTEDVAANPSDAGELEADDAAVDLTDDLDAAIDLDTIADLDEDLVDIPGEISDDALAEIDVSDGTDDDAETAEADETAEPEPDEELAKPPKPAATKGSRKSKGSGKSKK